MVFEGLYFDRIKSYFVELVISDKVVIIISQNEVVREHVILIKIWRFLQVFIDFVYFYSVSFIRTEGFVWIVFCNFLILLLSYLSTVLKPLGGSYGRYVIMAIKW